MKRLLDAEVTEETDLGTSHEWDLRRVTLADGRQVFVKRARRPLGGVFAAEAAGLRWLAEADDAPVPEVLAADDSMLVLPWIESSSPSPTVAERFGRELAALHGAGAPSYGAPWPGYIASLPLDNAGADGDGDGAAWSEWYARRRILPYVRVAVDRGALSARDAAEIESAAGRIADLAGPPEPPARIHGDLWSGNVVWGENRAWLIDPAAHGGHRETDLAMLVLFGAPRLDRVLAAYQEVSPLADGWRARVPLHQLHPILVHIALFGAAYRERALAAARTLT